MFTDATLDGAWSGGLTIYKERELDGVPSLDETQPFDFALNYPFVNPTTGSSSVSLNTNSLGTAGTGTVANWVRITDAVPGDNKKITGQLRFTDSTGKVVLVKQVSLPDGGRFDFAGHEAIGPKNIGLAQFIPDSGTDSYYFETSRYWYEGVGASSTKFYTAFPLPHRPPTGAGVTGRISNFPGEISIVEIVNASDEDAAPTIKFFAQNGSLSKTETPMIPAKGSIHRVITGSILATNTVGSAEVSGSPETFATITLVYRFDQFGQVTLGYAPPFNESAGKMQITDFNSFIGHSNNLEVFNSTDTPLNTTVTILDYLNQPLPQINFVLPARAATRLTLALPKDSYGTVIVDTGSSLGVIVRNDIERKDEYTMPFGSR